MNEYYYERAKYCLIAHRIYQKTTNPSVNVYITEVKGRTLAKFMTDAMNEKLTNDR